MTAGEPTNGVSQRIYLLPPFTVERSSRKRTRTLRMHKPCRTMAARRRKRCGFIVTSDHDDLPSSPAHSS